MSNIDTRATKAWGKIRPERLPVTQVANRIMQIRDRHNRDLQRELEMFPGAGTLIFFRHERDETREIRDAVYGAGWSLAELELEIEQRTTARWARKIMHGWF